MTDPTRAVFLDRDGVINADTGYVYRWSDFQFLPGAVQAMQRLRAAGWRLVVVTNQSGLARGLYTPAQYQALTQQMCETLRQAGAELTAVYHCPHHPAGRVAALAVDCLCRKPQPGLILQAAAEHGISLPHSVLVGDKLTDVQAARAAGVGRSYLVGQAPQASQATPLYPDCERHANLADCVQALLETA